MIKDVGKVGIGLTSIAVGGFLGYHILDWAPDYFQGNTDLQLKDIISIGSAIYLQMVGVLASGLESVASLALIAYGGNKTYKSACNIFPSLEDIATNTRNLASDYLQNTKEFLKI